ATSPALWPPMPSASSASPALASQAIWSSLCSRAQPTSVRPLICSVGTLFTSKILGYLLLATAQGIDQVMATLHALVDVLVQRTVDDSADAGRQIGAQHAHIDMLLVGNLVHQAG